MIIAAFFGLCQRKVNQEAGYSVVDLTESCRDSKCEMAIAFQERELGFLRSGIIFFLEPKILKNNDILAI
ncbi:hypothetical protein [Nostoc sp. FACHB-280]|uniref:hypothetical protein n=1 Tax=Nostoc sp. FACHB-280 TaxID=2692839 RepID=UPI00168A4A70|nr:hypothetical protein [Nostoc sp. FACHB-280]MBD2494954.1 hypothetical protein [Nostoc sp. FACHB-280]